MRATKKGKFGGRGRVAVLVALAAAALLASMACFQDTSRSLVLTTTTSTYDSGLLDYIIPPFEEEYNANVRVISVGTGQALAIGARGGRRRGAGSRAIFGGEIRGGWERSESDLRDVQRLRNIGSAG